MKTSIDQKQQKFLFHHYENNPILTPTDWPYLVNAVFNPGAVEIDGETLLLVRVEDMRGFSHFTLARSKDGKTNWCIDSTPTVMPHKNSREAEWGIEDPRIVYLQERQEYAITYVSFSKGGPLVSLMLTKDFRKFNHMGALLPPEDKDASLFPRRFKGRFALIHRPIIRGEAHIWISFSPDLKYWGEHEILIPTRPGWWDCHRVGLGTQPIETSEGWLIIYHGVRITTSGSLYRVGLALLDLDNPKKIIHRSQEWVFGPKEKYEYTGDVPGVTFPSGAIIDKETGELRVYYGAADKVIGLALANMEELMEYILKCQNSDQTYP